MATKIGPKTVTQRDRSKALAFCVDAANSDSYGGEPTTNLCANSSFGANGDVALTSNVTVRGQSFTRKCVNNSSSSTTPGLWPIDSTITVSQSTQYTFSLRGFSNTTTGGGNAYLYVKNQSAGSDLVWNTAIGAFPTEDEYFANPANEIVSHTFTTPSGCTQLKIGVLFTGHSTTPGGIFYIKNVQLEAKSAATPFVLGSRTASNAVENISGVGAQGTTLTGTFAAYGQQLFKPTIRNVLATFDSKKGHIGGAYWDFDGSDEYINTGIQPDFIHTNATLIMWVTMDNIAAAYAHGNHNSKRFYMGTDGGYFAGGVQNQNNRSSHSGKTLFSARGISNNDWFMGTVVADSGTAKMYVNGELDSTFSYTQSSGSNPDGNFKIGTWQHSSDYWWNGQVAICMIWSAALTAKEIKDIYIAQKGRFGK